MKQQNITVLKTARYFMLGEPGTNIRNLWFVCHGYGQLASDFLNKFEVLNNGENLIIAPEGLHRFYQSGFSESIGASWMTKEDRLNDITDYINYLNRVYLEIINSLNDRNVKINILGFSQGTATVCRWLLNDEIKADNLILCGGSIPPDINFQKAKLIFDNTSLWLVIGNQDRIVNQDVLNNDLKTLDQHNVKYQFYRYEGNHDIHEETLKTIAQKL